MDEVKKFRFGYGGEGFQVSGGPAGSAPDAVDVVVNLTGRRLGYDREHVVEWPDFDVIPAAVAARAAGVVLRALARGDRVHVGCGYGRGRTGTLFGVVARVIGTTADPVEFVRLNYKRTAIENAQQEAFVREFPGWRVLGLRARFALGLLWNRRRRHPIPLWKPHREVRSRTDRKVRKRAG